MNRYRRLSGALIRQGGAYVWASPRTFAVYTVGWMPFPRIGWARFARQSGRRAGVARAAWVAPIVPESHPTPIRLLLHAHGENPLKSYQCFMRDGSERIVWAFEIGGATYTAHMAYGSHVERVTGMSPV